MDILKFSGITVVAIMLILIVKQIKSEFATLITLFTCVLLIVVALANFYPTIKYLESIISNSSFSRYVTVLLKALGIGFAAQTTADICRDAGESAISAKVEMIGKAEILLISLPLLKNIVELAGEIIYT